MVYASVSVRELATGERAKTERDEQKRGDDKTRVTSWLFLLLYFHKSEVGGLEHCCSQVFVGLFSLVNLGFFVLSQCSVYHLCIGSLE